MSWPTCFPEWAERARPVVHWRVYQKLRNGYHHAERSSRVAEDAIQSALLKATERVGRDHFPAFPAFLAWLKLVAWRDAIAILRKEDVPPPPKPGDERATNDPGSDDRPSREEELAELHKCMERLGEDEREIVRWRDDDGLIFEEIAARLEIVTSSAFKRYRRAVGRLRRCMERELS